MKTKDLKNGMKIRLKNGEHFIVIDDNFVNFRYYIPISFYNENLRNKNNEEYDVQRIYKVINKPYIGNEELLWERVEKSIYKEKEVGILKALDLLGFIEIRRKKDFDKTILEAITLGSKYFVLNNRLFQDIQLDKKKFIDDMLNDYIDEVEDEDNEQIKPTEDIR